MLPDLRLDGILNSTERLLVFHHVLHITVSQFWLACVLTCNGAKTTGRQESCVQGSSKQTHVSCATCMRPWSAGATGRKKGSLALTIVNYKHRHILPMLPFALHGWALVDRCRSFHEPDPIIEQGQYYYCAKMRH